MSQANFTPFQELSLAVYAPGKTKSERSNARGHAFEQFIARLLECFGYDRHEFRHLNQIAVGMEVDVSSRAKLTGEKLISECKAYSSPVAASAVQTFYGKLADQRLDDPSLHGFFIATPSLTSDGHALAERLMDRDARFKYFNASDVVQTVREAGLLGETVESGLFSDRQIVVWEGPELYEAAKELDNASRLATRVIVWGEQTPPDHLIDILTESTYADGLEVVRRGQPTPDRARVQQAELFHVDDSIVEVSGSGSDFEYQLPASPPYFVGRREQLRQLNTLIDRSRNGHGCVAVLNAQSGWGKSSLALKFKQIVESDRGVAFVYDSRTASDKQYVAGSIRDALRRAETSGLLRIPKEASFASVSTSVRTLAASEWRRKGVLLIFFDQFENVFASPALTRDFQHLALAIRDVERPVVIGFSWKTDLVGWTENHPYAERDAIRGVAEVVRLPKFGANDIDNLIRRLESEIGAKLVTDLRSRLREYSQGLPWLFKKLANHVGQELQANQSQESLLAESLNVQGLFDADIAGLNPDESRALRMVARNAPMIAAEAVEVVGSAPIQALVNARLLVQVGERLDIYWDIFRDYLNTGDVPIRDAYIIRSTVGSVSRLVRALVDADDMALTVQEAADRLETSEGVIYNYSRDLRQMGIIGVVSGRVRLIAADDEDLESTLRQSVATSLKRHQAFHIASDLAGDSGEVDAAEFAEALSAAFSSVRANASSWRTYANAFIQWFEYAGLADASRSSFVLGKAPPQPPELLEARPGRSLGKTSFPLSPPGPALALLKEISSGIVQFDDIPARRRRALSDLLFLNIVSLEGDTPALEDSTVVRGDAWHPPALYDALSRHPATAASLESLRNDEKAADVTVGSQLESALGTQWTDGTRALMGKTFRAWARQAGVVRVRKRGRKV